MTKKIFCALMLLTMIMLPVSRLSAYMEYTPDEGRDPVLHFFDSPTSFSRPIVHQPLHSHVLHIRFPRCIKKTPSLCGYYKGYRLRFNGDYCLINEKIPSDSFTLVITDAVSRRCQGACTSDLKRTPEKCDRQCSEGKKDQKIRGEKCRMFYISKKHSIPGVEWEVEEEAKDNIPIVIPKTAIIIVLDPDLVSSVKSDDDLTKIKAGSETPLYLPIIEIKATCDTKMAEDACQEALCAALDTRALHSPFSSTTRTNQSMVVAMNTLER